MKISIIIPSYNSGKYIEETLLSIINQTYKNFEIIWIDGKSTDETYAVYEKYKKYIKHFICEKDNGQSDAINKGIKLISGDIWAWQNADDLYHLNAFENIVKYFQKADSNVGMIYGSIDYVDSNSHFLYSRKSWKFEFKKLRRGRFNPIQPSVFFSTKIIEKIDGVSEKLHYVMDYDFFVQIGLFYEIVSVDDIFGKFRVHNESKTTSGNFYKKFKTEYNQTIAKYSDGTIIDQIFIQYYKLRHSLGYILKYGFLFRKK
jgi:glycosyltransferase involved in cell wall biosynthesis